MEIFKHGIERNRKVLTEAHMEGNMTRKAKERKQLFEAVSKLQGVYELVSAVGFAHPEVYSEAATAQESLSRLAQKLRQIHDSDDVIMRPFP